jgi:hypothetical protein
MNARVCSRLVCELDPLLNKTAGALACVNRTVQQHGSHYLPNFNPTNAALDVMHAIAANAGPGEKAFVYGVSYGTYWVNR